MANMEKGRLSATSSPVKEKPHIAQFPAQIQGMS